MDSRERKLLTAARLNDVERVKQLLEAGVDPDIEGPFGPVISMALLLGHTVVARLLVEAGADLHVTDDKGWTPLHWAAKTGDVELVLAMIEADADSFAIDKIGDSPFDVLKKHEHMRALDMIRRKYPREYMQWLEGQEGRI
jgi:ankyrin repeat protein